MNQIVNLKNNNLLVKFRVENDLTFSINSIAQIYETGLIGGKALAIIPANDNSRIAVLIRIKRNQGV